MGPQGRSGRMRKISRPTGIRSPDRPARSESLYRLSYRGPPSNVDTAQISSCLHDVIRKVITRPSVVRSDAVHKHSLFSKRRMVS